MKGVIGRWALLVIIAIGFLIPCIANAQIVISEIMFDPKGSDTGREWVELHNTGANDVALVAGSGKNSWRVGDSSKHTLTDPSGGIGRGSLIVPAGGYFVISNDPATFVSEYPDGSYAVIKSSISLNNASSTVSIIDGSGAVIDSVAYTNTLGASDNGASFQRQSDGSWIAALPTPGADNSATVFVAPAETSSPATTTTAASTQQSTSSYVPPPAPVLFADAGDDRTVIVGADVQFDARAYDRSQQSVDTVRFLWNFGDGVTAEGESVLHHFSYPDRYAVILSIAHDKSAATDEFVVDAQPAALSFFLLSDGGVAIGNESGRELDLSGWIIRQSADLFAPQFILPPRTKVLAGASLRISVDTLHFRATDQTMLEYPNGTLAYSMNANISALERGSVVTVRSSVSASVPQVSVSGAHTAAAATPVASHRADVSSSMTDVSETQESDPVVATSTDADSSGKGSYSGQQAAAAALFDTSDAGWLAAAIAISLSAGGAVAVASRLKRREWTVIDEGGE